ncbi:hypothetical protein OBBRIDRAFT_780989 [Obba rivulosa]|uniref:Pentatricopeptide repeat-containing protein n=1 Tax=Obba rivulosa TaxID=1052685 RepID=A0A8E2ATV5_9APHY|nr:hypothetical protein OBBRIDRAFT_780989 [Obba rivulosa]
MNTGLHQAHAHPGVVGAARPDNKTTLARSLGKLKGSKRLQSPEVSSSSEERSPDSPPVDLGLYQALQQSNQLERDSRPVDPSSPPSLDEYSARRSQLLKIMTYTDSVEESWDAYQRLLNLPPLLNMPPAPYYRLHSLARLLSSTTPKTRLVFLRLLSVLSCIHRTGGMIHQWQWNSLIDCAGKGWRVTRLEDFQTALDVYEDMVALRAPGATFFRHESTSMDEVNVDSIPLREPVRPDIITYTTLVNIAARTLDPTNVERAMSILHASGFPPNRITYLALLRFYTRRGDLTGVRDILNRIRERGFELGTDGINACIWAFGRKGRLDVASALYRILRHRIVPEDEVGQYELELARKRLSSSESIHVPDDTIPDATTYYILIQVYSYHGDLVKCLQVFMDMLRTPGKVGIVKPKARISRAKKPDVSSPTLPAFRAIFLGFSRHGQHTPIGEADSLTNRLTRSSWNLANLESLFDSFITLPHSMNPSSRTIYWLLRAYAVTTSNDMAKLRTTWNRLAKRFGNSWGGRLDRLRREIFEGQDQDQDQDQDHTKERNQ